MEPRAFSVEKVWFCLEGIGTGDLFFPPTVQWSKSTYEKATSLDTGYIVAFEDTSTYSVGSRPWSRDPNLKAFFGGEGLVCEFKGRGKVWVQTRCVSSFLRWANMFRPVESSGG